jgi:hypothetical protein
MANQQFKLKDRFSQNKSFDTKKYECPEGYSLIKIDDIFQLTARVYNDTYAFRFREKQKKSVLEMLKEFSDPKKGLSFSPVNAVTCNVLVNDYVPGKI